MRTNIGYKSSSVSKDMLFAIDLHEFINKTTDLNDMEIAQEYGVTSREIEALKSRIRR